MHGEPISCDYDKPWNPIVFAAVKLNAGSKNLVLMSDLLGYDVMLKAAVSGPRVSIIFSLALACKLTSYCAISPTSLASVGVTRGAVHCIVSSDIDV